MSRESRRESSNTATGDWRRVQHVVIPVRSSRPKRRDAWLGAQSYWTKTICCAAVPPALLSEMTSLPRESNTTP